MEPIYWLIGLGAFIIVEMITLGLTSIWFAGGCLAAFLAGLAGAPLWLQIVLFLAVSILLLLFTKPVVERHLNRSRERTNVESVRNRECKVIEEIDNFNQRGKVVLDGMEWTARSAEGNKIPAETKVSVVDVRGAHLEVVRLEEEQAE